MNFLKKFRLSVVPHAAHPENGKEIGLRVTLEHRKGYICLSLWSKRVWIEWDRQAKPL